MKQKPEVFVSILSTVIASVNLINGVSAETLKDNTASEHVNVVLAKECPSIDDEKNICGRNETFKSKTKFYKTF